MYSSLRFTDQSGDGLAVTARRLLVLSASLMILARSDFVGAVLTCKRFRSCFSRLLVVRDLFNEPGDILPEDFGDHLARDLLVFNGIVQERGNDEVGVLSVRRLSHERGDLQQVIDIGLLGGALRF
jgi:hypothetical protein